MIEMILKGDVRAVSRALSLMEEEAGPESRQLLKLLYPHSDQAFVVGITGGTGTGKSTIAEGLAREFLKNNRQVGIIAVDPTSPFSGGAILGDRIRMQSLSTDPRVFIRSMATRGRLGGLSSAVNDGLIVLAAAGYEVLFVETVGVGQDEIDIAATADITLVILVPGLGDDVQASKAGLMEIGDVFVLNKADREGARKARTELEAHCSLLAPRSGWVPPIVETIAIEGKGLSELAAAILKFKSTILQGGTSAAKKVEACRSRLSELLRDRLLEETLSMVGRESFDLYARRVADYELDPYSAVEELLKIRKS